MIGVQARKAYLSKDHFRDTNREASVLILFCFFLFPHLSPGWVF